MLTQSVTERLDCDDPAETEGKLPKRLGSFGSWLVSRIFQVVAFVMWLPVLRGHPPWQFTIALTGFFILANWIAYPISYGSADQEGITFRRYFKRYHFSWNEVSDARWGAKSGWNHLKLTFRESAGLSSAAEFAVIANLWQLGKAYRGWRPEIVDWVMSRLPNRRTT